MNRADHTRLGAAWGATAGILAGRPWWEIATGAIVAAAAGPLPDLDQQVIWRTLDRIFPDEVLGHGGPMRHRGVTHWWGIPAALGAALVLRGTMVPAWAWWPAMAVVVGVASHLWADLLFGERSRGRGAGIPVLPWWGHVGLGLKSGGRVERATTGPLAVACVAAAGWWVAGAPGVTRAAWGG